LPRRMLTILAKNHILNDKRKKRKETRWKMSKILRDRKHEKSRKQGKGGWGGDRKLLVVRRKKGLFLNKTLAGNSQIYQLPLQKLRDRPTAIQR